MKEVVPHESTLVKQIIQSHVPPGEGAHKHFFDRDARPRANLNYPKNRMTLNSNPKK